MKAILLGCAIFVLFGCANQDTPISREQAIERVRSLAVINQPEIKATNIPLTNIRAERMKLADAAVRVWGAATIPNGQDPDRVVWLVTVQGEWHNGMDAPGVALTQTPYTRFAVIVDATTGDTLGSSYSP